MGSDDAQRLLGEIKAKSDLTYDEVAEMRKDVGKLGERLTKLETRAGTIGGIAGAVLGVGMSLLTDKLKIIVGGG